MPATDNTLSENQCPSCNGNVEDELAEIPQPVCSDCGFVVGEEVPPELDTDSDGAQSGIDSWETYYSVRNATEEQVAAALELLEQIEDKLLLSSEIKQQAAEVYKAFAIEGLTDGRSTRQVIGVSICLGCRNVGAARPSERVARALEVDSDSLRRLLRVMQQELELECTASSPSAYLSYFCRDLGLTDEVEHEANDLVGQFKSRSRITGKHPAGIAGAGVYLVASGITQREIADVAGVTKETIRVRLNEMRGEL